MLKRLKFNHTTFILAEVVVFYILARWGRRLLDAVLVPLDLAPALLIAARIVFVILIIVIAYFLDRALFKFLTAKGWIE